MKIGVICSNSAPGSLDRLDSGDTYVTLVRTRSCDNIRFTCGCDSDSYNVDDGSGVRLSDQVTSHGSHEQMQTLSNDANGIKFTSDNVQQMDRRPSADSTCSGSSTSTLTPDGHSEPGINVLGGIRRTIRKSVRNIHRIYRGDEISSKEKTPPDGAVKRNYTEAVVNFLSSNATRIRSMSLSVVEMVSFRSVKLTNRLVFFTNFSVSRIITPRDAICPVFS